MSPLRTDFNKFPKGIPQLSTIHYQLSTRAQPYKGNLQLVADDLAADGLGQAGAEFHDPGVLVRRGTVLDIVLDFLLQLIGRLLAGNQHDAGLDHLTTDFIGIG